MTVSRSPFSRCGSRGWQIEYFGCGGLDETITFGGSCDDSASGMLNPHERRVAQSSQSREGREDGAHRPPQTPPDPAASGDGYPDPWRLSMNRSLLYLALVVSAACVISQESFCATGPTSTATSRTITSSPTPTPTPTPTPGPTATPTPTPESCGIDYTVLRPEEGIVVPVNGSGRVSLTPYQNVRNADGSISAREVSVSCNLPRTGSIEWTTSSLSVTLGTGFFPEVRRTGLGEARVFATLEGHVSNSVVVR